MALALASSLEYARREPERSPVHRVVRDHLETFLAEQSRHERSVPAFVERTFRRYLTCGVLAHGFARFRCPACRLDRLVAFSCKGRGLCPSCGGRRMTERAAHLVDHVLPSVPMRQWVLSLPYALRYRLALDHALTLAVLRVFTRALLADYRRRARRARIANGRTGTVTAIQRFGSALNLNVHFHTLAPDGVFHECPSGELTFTRLPSPTTSEVDALLRTVRDRVLRLLVRRGLWTDPHPDAHDDLDADAPEGARLYAASVRQLSLTGPRAGQPIRRLRSAAFASPPRKTGSALHAHADGFDLHAGVSVRKHARKKLERLCRYLLRPPLAQRRLRQSANGLLTLELKRPFRDGTTHYLYEPLELLEKLAVLIPRPHKNLLLYHGVFAPSATWRRRVVTLGRGRSDAQTSKIPEPGRCRPNPTWAELMRRGLRIDALACPRCTVPMTLVATILERRAIDRILTHLELPTDRIRTAPPRAPPDDFDLDLHGASPGAPDS